VQQKTVISSWPIKSCLALDMPACYTQLIPSYWICMFFSAIYFICRMLTDTEMSRAEQASSRHRTDEHRAFRLLRDRRLFRLAVAIAVTLSIVASTTLSADGTSGPKATALREASTIIFLVLTGLLFLQTCHLAKFDLSGGFCLPSND